MKKSIFIFIIVLVVIFTANYIVMAIWSEPAGSPPNNNVPAPINVGPMSQSKEGNLEVGSLTLGGVTRSSWPDGIGGAACNWEGTKCNCKDDQTSTWTGSEISSKITIGTTCSGGQITSVNVINFQVSTGNRNCSSLPPVACTPGLYTHN